MKTTTIRWTGPYGLPGYEDVLPKPPSHPGVYLFTVETDGGYLVCSPGITVRTILQRMEEHVGNFLKGNYNVLDPAALKRQERVEVWHGWGWTPEKRADFKARHETIRAATETMLRTYRVFTTDEILDKRLLERIEASVMQALYALPQPHRGILDEGMHFARRRQDEEPIRARQDCGQRLLGLPSELDI